MLCAHEKFYINGGCVAMNKKRDYQDLTGYFYKSLRNPLKYSLLLQNAVQASAASAALPSFR